VKELLVEREVDWLTPAERMPWSVSAPFRMRPNLEKLDPENPALLLSDDLAPAYARERKRVLLETRERALVGVAHREALAEIERLISSPAARERARVRAARDNSLRLTIEPVTSDGEPKRFPFIQTALTPTLSRAAGEGADLALSLQEDFVILKNESETLRTEYLSVCFPSRWDPREKLGLDFAQIHAPVADNQMLLAAGPSIMTMAFIKQPMLRHVWLVVPSASLPQHPDQNDYSWSETLKDPSPLLPRLFFRVERQTTWPLPHLNRAVFFIRVMMSPIVDVLAQSPARARELHDALASMTPAVVEYRGMTAAMPRLLDELSRLEAASMRST
jgi:dimethylamine monooxygenase subunit A